MRRPAFIGIDLAIAKGKKLPIAVCTKVEGRLLPIALHPLDFLPPPAGKGNAKMLEPEYLAAFAEETAVHLKAICEWFDLEPSRIAIDAPSAPRKEGESSRCAEKALSDAKINCFSTPSEAEFESIKASARLHLETGGVESKLPHANKLWMLAGFKFFERLASIAPCIEVFPNAIAHALGCSLHKSKPGGVEAQLAAASKYTGWPDLACDAAEFSEIAWCPAHDRLDAYLSAWVASLSESDRFPYGDPATSDAIWVPRLGHPAPFPQANHPVSELRVETPAKRTLHLKAAPIPVQDWLSRPCPACEQKIFVRWPWGWDGHAAHVCTGLQGVEPTARKAEFKQRFGHLFGSSAAALQSEAEDAEDEAAFEDRSRERDLDFDDVVLDLRRGGKL